MSLLKVNQVTDLAGDTPDGVGRILQVVSTTKTDTFTSSSTSFTDITGLSVSITPTSTSSKILVLVNASVGNTGNTAFSFRLMRGTTAIGVGDVAGSRARSTTSQYSGGSANTFHANTVSANVLDSPNTTSATVYALQGLTNTDTFTVNRTGDDSDVATTARMVSSITVTEVAG